MTTIDIGMIDHTKGSRMNQVIFAAFLATVLITNCSSSSPPDAFLPPTPPPARETISIAPELPDDADTDALPCECSVDGGTESTLSDP